MPRGSQDHRSSKIFKTFSGPRIFRGDSPRTLAAYEPGPMWALSVGCRLPRSPLFKNFRRVRLRFGAWGSPKGGFSTTVHASTREAIWISLWFNGCLCLLEGGRSEYLGDFFEGGRAAVLQGRAFRKIFFFPSGAWANAYRASTSGILGFLGFFGAARVRIEGFLGFFGAAILG